MRKHRDIEPEYQITAMIGGGTAIMKGGIPIIELDHRGSYQTALLMLLKAGAKVEINGNLVRIDLEPQSLIDQLMERGRPN